MHIMTFIDFNIFGIHNVIFQVRAFKFITFWELTCFLNTKFRFILYSNMAVFWSFFMIYLLISLGTLLARENIEGIGGFFSNWVCRCS